MAHHVNQPMVLLFFHLALWSLSTCTDPLYLTPLLDRREIEKAQGLSEVKDTSGVIPKSYAGLITVDKKLRNHMFFWFFPATTGTQTPLLVWLNGGPTISSMLGLLLENGPVRVFEDADGSVKYKRWRKSWAETFAMLYIDNPVGTGYSFSESGDRGYRLTRDGYTQDLFSFMQQFYVLFPDYLKQELYIGGQSYAGKFVPSLAHRIHQENQAGNSSLPLTGIYLGGPFFDPITQGQAQGYFFYALGAVSYAQFKKHKKNIQSLFSSNFTTQNETFQSIFLTLIGITDYTLDNYDTAESGKYSLIYSLMNTPRIRQLVHVGSQIPFHEVNIQLNNKYGSDILVSTKLQMAQLMDNYKVLIYNGDYDGIITAAMTEEAILSTPWSLQAVYNESDRFLWQQGNDLYGFYTHTGKFCRVVIYRAGHQTPLDQPDSTREMMQQFVRHGCVDKNQARGGSTILTGDLLVLAFFINFKVLNLAVSR